MSVELLDFRDTCVYFEGTFFVEDIYIYSDSISIQPLILFPCHRFC